MKNVHEVTFEVKAEEWEKILDEVFEKRNKEVKIDGFRKGKCPKKVYMQKMGVETLFMDALDKVYPLLMKHIIEDEKLEMVCRPDVDIKEIDKDHVVLVATVTTKPEVTLGKYKDLGVKKEEVKVTKAEVDAELNKTVKDYAELVPKKDGKVENGDVTVIDFVGYLNGEEFEGGSATDHKLEVGSHSFVPGFEEGMVGMKLNETKDIKLTFPKDYVENLAGKEVTFKVTVKEISTKKLPKLDEDFFKDLGLDDIKTEAEFRKKLEKDLTTNKENEEKNKYIDACLAKACEGIKVELTDGMIEDQIDYLVQMQEQDMKRYNIGLEQFLELTHKTMDDLRNELKPTATEH